MSIAVMKQALEALENKRHEYRAYQAITVLRQAIEQAKKEQATIENNSQDWAGMDGAIAYQLIERHSNTWADARKMMHEWLEANQREQAEKQFNPDWDQQAVLVERIRELEAQQALDKKADNARELGLDYEPDPVAWVCEGFGKEKHNLDYVQDDIDALPVGTPLYTAPPRKPWVGLTDDEITELDYSGTRIDFVRAIEAKLKEKNGAL